MIDEELARFTEERQNYEYWQERAISAVKRALKAEARLKIAMEALETYTGDHLFSVAVAIEAIAKINALKTEGK